MGSVQSGQRWGAGAATGWAAFESFGAAAHVLSDDGRIVEANPAFERLYCASRAAFLGRRHEELCAGTGAARRRTIRMLREAAARGSWQGTFESRASDGRRFTTRAHVYPTRVDGRRYFVCIQERTVRAPEDLAGGAPQGRPLGASG
jgi:PAS domain S-box-containing protein